MEVGRTNLGGLQWQGRSAMAASIRRLQSRRFLVTRALSKVSKHGVHGQKVLGDSFPSTIETAIRSAAVHIAILSKGYAESPWCLEELDLMLRSKAKIIPLFYGVKPSDLRYIERGVYGKAFTD
ncbi:probable 2' cyclic ADP-D-ribose synthase BdTIR [Cryptomeria japonica]|uniref:probable 2' cyclic ADP-D-ribose synthase BdTIR n=1 Tax=Cryptomeria japonica TaxID=3369 RepID=UPI0027DAAE58|nr:probable 2' cyclic ADP-D-ribose synthase BdTIR [Cryptomeria japonica]